MRKDVTLFKPTELVAFLLFIIHGRRRAASLILLCRSQHIERQTFKYAKLRPLYKGTKIFKEKIICMEGRGAYLHPLSFLF